MDKIELNRESILSGAIREWARRNPHLVQVMSDEERRASLDRVLAEAPTHGEVWVFGYGSLIWNPAFHFEETRTGTIHGYHRQFCLWTQIGRGSPRNPGLVLALERGGSCRGVVFRIAATAVRTELDIVWRREMLTSAYRPRWLWARTGGGRVPAIAFVINHAHERYSGRLTDETVARSIATATGPLGPCREYLFETVRHLAELGIHDRRLEDLARRVRCLHEAS